MGSDWWFGKHVDRVNHVNWRHLPHVSGDSVNMPETVEKTCNHCTDHLEDNSYVTLQFMC